MTTLNATTATHGFNMLSIPEVDFNTYQSSSGTSYSYLTDNGHDIDLFGSGFTGGATPSGGTVTNGQIDFDNDDFANPDVLITNASADLATMTNNGASGNAVSFIFELIDGSNDGITGSGFADTLKGLGGDDTIDGGSGADSILGGNGDDFISGGFGDDTMDGGSGSDWLDYTYSSESWLVDLQTNTTEASGIAVDSISNFENALMSSGNDTVLGTTGDNVLKGAGGDDSLEGGAGSDTIAGGDDDDFVKGGAGADNLSGDNGFDILSYQGSSAGVNVNLETEVVSGGDAAGDTIIGFEHVYGSTKNDVITGTNAHGNDLRGSVGNDSLTGLDGNDTLDGGSGDDTLIGGNNPDILVGGSGADVINGGASVDKADYTKASTGVNASLATGGISGDAAGDSYASIEILSGSNFGDTLTGSNANDDIRGRGGSDVINGGAGNDKLLGYSGNDTLVGGAGNDTLTGGGHNDHFVFSGAFGDDTIADMNAGALIRDVIEINGFGPNFDSFAEILAVTTDVGGNAVIDINGNTITLTGVTKAQLDANDFQFG